MAEARKITGLDCNANALEWAAKTLRVRLPAKIQLTHKFSKSITSILTAEAEELDFDFNKLKLLKTKVCRHLKLPIFNAKDFKHYAGIKVVEPEDV